MSVLVQKNLGITSAAVVGKETLHISALSDAIANICGPDVDPWVFAIEASKAGQYQGDATKFWDGANDVAIANAGTGDITLGSVNGNVTVYSIDGNADNFTGHVALPGTEWSMLFIGSPEADNSTPLGIVSYSSAAAPGVGSGDRGIRIGFSYNLARAFVAFQGSDASSPTDFPANMDLQYVHNFTGEDVVMLVTYSTAEGLKMFIGDAVTPAAVNADATDYDTGLAIGEWRCGYYYRGHMAFTGFLNKDLSKSKWDGDRAAMMEACAAWYAGS